MPRGTRAIHGAEVQGGMHGHGNGETTFVSPAATLLAATCWCEMHIVVAEQRAIRQGRTYTCGLPLCTAGTATPASRSAPSSLPGRKLSGSSSPSPSYYYGRA